MTSRSGVSDSLFWLRAGHTWQDRARIAMYWLSPYCVGYRTAEPRPVRTSFLDGRILYLRPASNDVRVLRNVFERQDNQLLEPSTGTISTIVDLGAYTGLTALDFAARYPDAEIVAVEPDEANYRCLRKNISSSSDKDRITTLNACISDRPGTERMSTTGPQWERSIVRDQGKEVPAITVCDALDMLGRGTVDLLKMDIEGGERLAFRNAGDWLPRVRWMLLEVHGEHMSLESLRAALAPSGRNTIMMRSATPGRWIELDAETARRFEHETRRIDLLVPPPGYPATDKRFAARH